MSAAEPGQKLDDLDIAGLIRTLPHRHPFLFVDKVVEMVAFESAVGIKAVSYNEPFFIGHFPDEPIMPGVLIIEALAQTAAAMSIVSMGDKATGSVVYFMGINGARFRKPVRPGDLLQLHVSLTRRKLGVWRFECEAKVDGKVVTGAQIMARIAPKS